MLTVNFTQGSKPAKNSVRDEHNLLSVPVNMNSEVSNEVEVTQGVLIRALRAAPVGPCYTKYLKWFQLQIRLFYKIIG